MFYSCRKINGGQKQINPCHINKTCPLELLGQMGGSTVLNNNNNKTHSPDVDFYELFGLMTSFAFFFFFHSISSCITGDYTHSHGGMMGGLNEAKLQSMSHWAWKQWALSLQVSVFSPFTSPPFPCFWFFSSPSLHGRNRGLQLRALKIQMFCWVVPYCLWVFMVGRSS